MGYLAPRGSTPSNGFLAPSSPPSGASGAPTITQLVATGGTTATLTFTPGSGATSHQVEFETPSGAANWLACPGAFVGSTFNATGFTPAQSLQLRLRGVNGVGPSAWVLSGTFFTDNTGSGSVEIPSVPVTAPAFSTQPTSQSVVEGSTATFSCVVTGNPTPTLQWQLSTNGGTTWANVSGATSTSYSRTGVLAESGTLFRVIGTNGVTPNATSAVVQLTVTAFAVPPTVTLHPVSQSVVVGQQVTFTSAASGTPTPTAQWRKNGSAITGATLAAYTFTAQLSDSGSTYTCAWTSGTTVVSQGAVLTVSLAPVSFSGPVPAQTGTVGAAYSLAMAGYFSGGFTPFAYSVSSGALPTGLSISQSTGAITGVPTAAGGFTAMIGALDTAGNFAQSGSVAFTIALASGGTITSKPLANNSDVLLVNTALTWVAVRNFVTGLSVGAVRTGLSTNASAVFTFSDPALSVGGHYMVEWVTATGQHGRADVYAT